jgi:asparagine synthetase B (glutamine-hydrolysing)
MWFTTEVRVPFLCNRVIDWALGNLEQNIYLDERMGHRGNKLCLRAALNGIAPDCVRRRRKVVLSEGVGLRGNDPERGMFRRFADLSIGQKRAYEIRAAFPDWHLTTDEESFYFEVFHSFGYSKASFMKDRVRANIVHPVAHRASAKGSQTRDAGL